MSNTVTSSNGIRIEEAQISDLPEIQDLLFEIFQEPEFNRQELGHTLWERMEKRYQDDSHKNEKDFWGKNNERRYAVVLRTVDNVIIGAAWILTANDELHIGELNKLYLRRDYRGLGLGKLVLTMLIERSKELGFSLLYLITGRELIKAIALYKSFGFEEVPQTRYQNSPNSLAMELQLA